MSLGMEIKAVKVKISDYCDVFSAFRDCVYQTSRVIDREKTYKFFVLISHRDICAVGNFGYNLEEYIKNLFNQVVGEIIAVHLELGYIVVLAELAET